VPRVGAVIGLFFWLFACVVVIASIGLLVLDAMDKVESIQRRLPWLPKVLERRSAFVLLLLIAVVLLVGDGYELLTKEMTEIEAPRISFAAPAAPRMASGEHTPWRSAKPADNSVHVDKGGKIEQQSSGPCSPNIVGGTTSVNCGPPPLKLEYTFNTLPKGVQGKFLFDPVECPVQSQMRITPNQSVPPPIRVAMDFDFPVKKVATVPENVGAFMGGGPFTVGTHVISSPVSPGIGPHHALIVGLCSDVPVKLIGEPKLVD